MFMAPMRILSACVLAVLPLGAQAVCMVTDVAGHVSLGGQAQIRLMDGLEARGTLTLGRGARVALLDLATGVEEVFLGPCRFQLDGQGRAHGAKPAVIRRGAAARGPLRLRPETLVLAGVPMRGDEAPPDPARLEVAALGPTVLEASPLLTWKVPGPGARTQFRLYDAAGTILLETDLEGNSFRLPALAPEKTHTWVLEAKVPGHAPQVASGTLRLLGLTTQAQLEQARPPTGAAFSERLVYAALLDDLGLKGEAQRYWQVLAAERPGDGRLRERVR